MRHLLALFLTLLVSPVRADTVVIFAAASLKEPVDALAALHGDAVVSYGGSGALARQVLQGAPADVVMLAHPVWMEELVTGGAVSESDVTVLAGNSLVLIGPKGAAPLPLSKPALTDRLSGGRLATGFTSAVPAGQYGRAALETLDLWDTTAAALAEVSSVRAALVLVARGESPLGITYATDAAASEAVSIVATFPADSHPPIRYPAAPVRGSAAGAAFVALAASPEGQAIFAEFGFRAP